MDEAVDRITEQWALEMPDLSTEAMAIFGRIYRIAATAGEIMQRVYARHGLTRADFDVVGTLRRSGPPFQLSPGALSATLMLTTSGTTGRLNRLENAGLITRTPGVGDGRSILVGLTSRGREVIDEAVKAGVVVQEQLIAAIPDARRTVLTELLSDVLAGCTDQDNPRVVTRPRVVTYE
ncbi:MAG: MarR family transcriptional regulator [Pseudonocardiales bacterium]|nr:MAG: MarR family transcriptional regulator [Pseudonocardiales bacterium]